MKPVNGLISEFISIARPSELELKKTLFLFRKGYISNVSIYKANIYFASLPESEQNQLGAQILNHSVNERDINFVLERNYQSI